MRKKPIFVLLALFVLLVMVQSVFAMSSANYQLNWYVPMTGIGGPHMTSANYAVDMTAGQSAVNVSSSANYDVRMGYWAGFPGSRIFLPTVRK